MIKVDMYAGGWVGTSMMLILWCVLRTVPARYILRTMLQGWREEVGGRDQVF